MDFGGSRGLTRKTGNWGQGTESAKARENTEILAFDFAQARMTTLGDDAWTTLGDQGRRTVKPAAAAASARRVSAQRKVRPVGRLRHQARAAASWRLSAARRG